MNNRRTGRVASLVGEPGQIILRARIVFGNTRLDEGHLRHIDKRLHAVMLRDRGRRPARSGWDRKTDMPKYVVSHRQRSMDRREIEQIVGPDLRDDVAECLRPVVFVSHHRTHRFASLQEEFGSRAAFRADPPNTRLSVNDYSCDHSKV